MKPQTSSRRLRQKNLIDEDGRAVRLERLPGLDEAALSEIQSSHFCPLPDSVREVLRFCRGLDGIIEQVDFTGRDLLFGAEDLFPGRKSNRGIRKGLFLISVSKKITGLI